MLYNSLMRKQNTSWQKVAPWYNRITDQGRGHYYHQHVVIPGVLRLLDLNSKNLNQESKVLDLACGNGVLAKSLPKSVKYTGIDIAEDLVKTAKNEDKNYNHRYLVGDVTKPEGLAPRSLGEVGFTHATIILALQNISDPKSVIENAARHLIPSPAKPLAEAGKLLIVLNHPAFRIPRQSSWGIDEARKIQYRRVDKYMSPMEIPINMNPSDKNSQVTMSYHFPLSDYSKMLKDAGFVINLIEEWTSDKESEGRARRMENRSRDEIPLFMTILATKK
ncbi:MAG: class I SAM-dependent methyltransferase [Candidatus Woesebacteria bacterium]|nr:MAG: class I SAM-dependent methyltransferase [Candidatus Woesebacteria bacterium]